MKMPLHEIRCDMRRRIFKCLLITIIFLLIISAVVYNLMLEKFYDIATKLILDFDITSELKIPEGSTPSTPTLPVSPKTDTQNPDTDQNNETPLPEQEETEREKSVSDKLDQVITLEDKRRILQLVSKKLTANDIKYLMSLLKGGLTPDEKKQAVELALKRFSSEEIKEIQNLYHKYKQYAN